MTRCRICLCLVLALVCSTARADVTIAVAGPMSGPYATLGALMRSGAQQAVSDINAAGGVDGEKLVLEIYDDGCDGAKATAIANQISGKGAKLVVGHLCSAASIPAAIVYAEEGVLQISPASSNPKLTDDRAGDLVFRLHGRDDQQASVAGAFLAERFGGKKIAIVHDKTAYGKGLADATKAALNAAGTQEALFEAYSPGERDYAALVSKLKAISIHALFIGGYHTEAGVIVRQMRDQAMDTIVVSGDALATDEYWSIAGDAAEGTLMIAPPDARKDAAAAAMVSGFRAKGVEPEIYLLNSYAAVQAWAQASANSGTTDASGVAASLSRDSFDTVLGKLSFDVKGDVSRPGFVIYEWKAGSYEYLQPR